MDEVTKKVATSLDLLGNKLKNFTLAGIESTDQEHPLESIGGNDGEIRYDDDYQKLRYHAGQNQKGDHMWPALAEDSDVQTLLDWKAAVEAEELWAKTSFGFNTRGGGIGRGTSGSVSVSPVFAAEGMTPESVAYSYTLNGTSGTATKSGSEVNEGVSLSYVAADTDREKTLATITATATYKNGKTKTATATWAVYDTLYISAHSEKSTAGLTRAALSANALYTEDKVASKVGDYTVDLDNDSYILFCIPTGLNEISSIKSAGFDVPFELVGTLNLPGAYYIYSTSNKIAAGKGYTFTIV